MWEFSAFLHSHGKDPAAHLQICPLILGIFRLGIHLGGCALVVLMRVIPFANFWEGGIFVVGLLSLVCLPLAVFLVRAYWRDVDTFQNQIMDFTLDNSRCACCETGHPDGRFCDRRILEACISAWFGSTAHFEQYVQSEVREHLSFQLLNNILTYSAILQATSPALWRGLGNLAREPQERVLPQLAMHLALWLAASGHANGHLSKSARQVC